MQDGVRPVVRNGERPAAWPTAWAMSGLKRRPGLPAQAPRGVSSLRLRCRLRSGRLLRRALRPMGGGGRVSGYRRSGPPSSLRPGVYIYIAPARATRRKRPQMGVWRAPRGVPHPL